MTSYGRQEPHASAGGVLVPVPPLVDGPPDAAGVAAWHLALSNFLAGEVPHSLLAFWLFPKAGGVLLLAPTELAADQVEIPEPSPRLAQHQLFAIEERVRAAGYLSAIAIPIRSGERDLGLSLFADLEPGRYGVEQAIHLHEVLRELVPTFSALAASPPTALSATGLPAAEPDEAIQTLVARAAAEARTGAEVLRLVSAALQAVIPHDRIEIAVQGTPANRWALLSTAPEHHRWGDSPEAAAQAIEALVDLADEAGIILVPDLRPVAPWPAHAATRATQRVRAVLGTRLTVAGGAEAWLFLGGPAAGMFRHPDVEALRLVAPIIALRVDGLRQALTAEVGQAQLAALQASQPRVARLVTLLATTRHWGEASQAFADEVTRALGFAECSFVLRLGDDRVVTVRPGGFHPLTDLPTEALTLSPLAPVIEGTALFLVTGPDGRDLAVPMLLAGRPVGAMVLRGGHPGSAGHPVTAAQQFANVIASHLELLRRTALPGRPWRSVDAPSRS